MFRKCQPTGNKIVIKIIEFKFLIMEQTVMCTQPRVTAPRANGTPKHSKFENLARAVTSRGRDTISKFECLNGASVSVTCDVTISWPSAAGQVGSVYLATAVPLYHAIDCDSSDRNSLILCKL